MNNISNTIFAQLGGNKFLAMTGARMVYSDRGLAFKMPRGSTKNRCTHVDIKLNSSDLYDVRYLKLVKMDLREIKSFQDIHATDLGRNFTEATGLDIHL